MFSLFSFIAQPCEFAHFQNNVFELFTLMFYRVPANAVLTHYELSDINNAIHLKVINKSINILFKST